MNGLFHGLLALLAWVPLPLGSNRTWSWAIMVIAACLLFMVGLVGYLRGRLQLTEAFRRARWALAALMLWWLWIALQGAPLPAEWVRLMSPKAHEIHALAAAALGQALPTTMTLSLDPHATRDFWFKTTAYLAVFTLTLLLVDSRRRVELLLQTLVICGTLQALYASVMTLSGLEYGFLFRKTTNLGVATGTFINRNHLAGYLNMCLAAGIGLMIARLGGEALGTWRRWLRSIARLLLGEKARLRIFLVVMVIGLVLTRSRMGNTAFFAGTLIVGALALLLMRNAPRSTLLFLASLVVLDLLIVGTWFGVDQVTQRIRQTEIQPSEIRTSGGDVMPTEDRDEVGRQAMGYLRDFPLTGSGAGSFYVVFPAYHNQRLSGFYDFAHNDYIQQVAETGMLGLGLSATVVLLALWQALSALRRRRDPLMRGAAFAVAMAICWLAIHSSVDFNMQIPANALTMTILLALAWIAASLDSERSRRTGTPQAAGQGKATPAQGQARSSRR